MLAAFALGRRSLDYALRATLGMTGEIASLATLGMTEEKKSAH
jgi:hypothetical protein